MQEKTEKPSQRKLRKAKQKGNVPKSSELASAMVLCSALLLLWALAPTFESRLKYMLAESFKAPELRVCSQLKPLLYPLLLFMGSLFIIALGANLVQTGFIWCWPQGKAKGERRWFVLLARVTLIALIGYFDLARIGTIEKVLLYSPSEKTRFIFEHVFFLLLKISLVLLLLGIADYIYQRWKYSKEMRMTKQEAKEEKRLSEGDRETKNRMRRR